MNQCTECGTQYTSRLAAEECADFDKTEAQNTREWFTHYNPNYRQ